MGHAGEADLGVTHGGSGVAIHGTEIALAIDKQIAQAERLRHAHHGVVHRTVAVRVVFTDDVTNDTGRLLVRLVPVVAEFVHGEQDAPMHRLQTVAGVWQGAPHDDRHRVVEIRLAHLVLEVDVEEFASDFSHGFSGSEGLKNQAVMIP